MPEKRQVQMRGNTNTREARRREEISISEDTPTSKDISHQHHRDADIERRHTAITEQANAKQASVEQRHIKKQKQINTTETGRRAETHRHHRPDRRRRGAETHRYYSTRRRAETDKYKSWTSGRLLISSNNFFCSFKKPIHAWNEDSSL